MGMIGSLEVARLAVDVHREHEGDEEPGVLSTRRVRVRAGIAPEYELDSWDDSAVDGPEQRRASRRPVFAPLAVTDVEDVEPPSSIEDGLIEAIDLRESVKRGKVAPTALAQYALTDAEVAKAYPRPHHEEPSAPRNRNDTEDSDTATSIGLPPIAPSRSRRPVRLAPAAAKAYVDAVDDDDRIAVSALID